MAIFIILLLCSCSNEEKPLEIKDKSFAETLLINRIKDNVSGVSGDPIVIKDNQKIIKLLTIVEGMKVKKGDYNKFMDELKAQDSYSFSITEEKKLESRAHIAYAFYVLDDGTFFFIENSDATKTYITTRKYPDQLNKIKDLLDIKF